MSADSLAKIQQRLGTEPMLIVGVKWDGSTEYLYGDKTVKGDYEGRVLDVATIEDVALISGAGSTSSVTVKLDDTDGTIKSFFDTNDIHKQPVTIYQGFSGIEDRFPVYEGQINTPIVWSEADRTLTFDVVTIVEEFEVGFSAEEGQFPNLPDSAIGQVWPLAFGHCLHMPALTFVIIPVGITTTNILVPDRTLALVEQYMNQRASFFAPDPNYLTYLFTTQAEAALNGDIQVENQINQLVIAYQEASQVNQQVINDMNQFLRLYNQQVQVTLDQLVGPVSEGNTILLNNAKYFPINTPFYARIGQFVAFGQVDQNAVFTFQLIRPPIPQPYPYKNGDGSPGVDWVVPAWTDADVYVDRNNHVAPIFNGTVGFGPHGEVVPVGYSVESSIDPEGLQVIPAGSTVTIISDLQMDWIVNIIPTTVTMVWAYKAVNNVRQLYPVPTDYWTQTTTQYGSLTAQIVRLKRPLSGYAFENWEDQIYVDQISSVGPNIADIIIWLIQQYTVKAYDQASFDLVRTQTQLYPCNFYLPKRGNVLSVIAEMAYQARCAVFIKNETFFITYLSAEPDPVATITEDDVQVGSLAISCSPTEELVTKIRASYQIDYAINPSTDLIIVNNNINRYGWISQDDTYYIYTDPVLVQKSATFWIIRKSQTWKKVTFKTMLNHLNLETYDTILLDFQYPWVAGDETGNTGIPVKGLIESAVYDSASNDITITCWTPVLFGTMEVNPLGWPATATETDFFPFVPQNFEATKIPAFYAGPLQGLVPLVLGGGTQYNVIDPHSSLKLIQARTNKGELLPTDADDELPLPPDLVQPPPFGTPLRKVRYDFNPIFATPKTPQQQQQSSTYPSKVVSRNDDGTFAVDVYIFGLDEDPQHVSSVTQVQITDDSGPNAIPAGTGVMVSVIQSKDGKTMMYYMQVPVWLA
jgi:hypothetical protein